MHLFPGEARRLGHEPLDLVRPHNVRGRGAQPLDAVRPVVAAGNVAGHKSVVAYRRTRTSSVRHCNLVTGFCHQQAVASLDERVRVDAERELPLLH